MPLFVVKMIKWRIFLIEILIRSKEKNFNTNFLKIQQKVENAKENSYKFETKLIVEAANGPTTMDGEKILLDKGAHFLPDVLCNGGGVTVSYFEWVKNLDHARPGRMYRKWEEKAKKNLLEIVSDATGV